MNATQISAVTEITLKHIDANGITTRSVTFEKTLSAPCAAEIHDDVTRMNRRFNHPTGTPKIMQSAHVIRWLV